jgi:transposase
MRTKRYRVTLTAAETTELQALITRGKAAARTQLHARILLQAAEQPDRPAAVDTRLAEALTCSVRTVERVRRRFVEEGVAAALVPHRPLATPRKLDGAAEARLIAEACSPPPAGRERWTLQLLADRLVELQVVETVSDETVRRTLKKTRSSPGW